MESLVTALVTGGLTLAGVIVSNLWSQAVMEFMIDELAKRVEKHNGMIERTYALAQDMALALAQHDIADLRRKTEV
ncbi:hypothetical protein [Eggerthella guodeyinii]|uniref:Uncharacterized protein n=1 Tax=Eggerthella guodeyinii TaxID=2690837 RepID=A0A6N7RJD1_9ACTN|nr:hypothetical protein [Eggerthella guodeyinii]MRX81091.1 hypothetical protein [Eggerthella guodeyinii]